MRSTQTAYLSKKSLYFIAFLTCFLSADLSYSKTQTSRSESAALDHTAKDSFEKMSPLMFRVKTSATPDLEKSSYGTGFVIDKKGLLVTNFHVVAESVLKPKKNNIYVMIDDKPFEAKVVNLDIVNDLALIKIEKEFSDSVRISNEVPVRGEEVYSHGLPEDLDWTVVKGTYNGIIKHGPYELIHMSSPINSGMSGGPTVNRKSELVGVNVSRRGSSQEISFSIPAQYVRDLLQDYNSSKNPFDVIQVMEKQSISLQNKLTDLVLSGLKKTKRIQDWNIPAYHPSIRCWGQNPEEDENSRFEVSEEACSVEHSIYLDGQRTFGIFQSDLKFMKNLSLNSSQWRRAQGKEWNESQAWVREFNKSSLINFDKPKCLRERVIVGHSIRTVRWCRQKILPFKDLEDNFVSILITKADRALVLDYTFSGFNQTNIREIIRSYLNFDYEGVNK